MKRKILSVLAVVGMLLQAGCSQNEMGPDATDELPFIEGENFQFYIGEDRYNELKSRRSGDDAGTSFEITDVWQTELESRKYLHVEVAHEKQCRDRFDIIWDGRTAESYPPQIMLMIKLNAEDCPDLNGPVADTLSLDLYEFIEDKALVDEAVFKVSNASSDQDVSYSNPDSTSHK